VPNSSGTFNASTKSGNILQVKFRTKQEVAVAIRRIASLEGGIVTSFRSPDKQVTLSYNWEKMTASVSFDWKKMDYKGDDALV